MYVRTDKGDAICPPPPHYKWRGHKNMSRFLPNKDKSNFLQVSYRILQYSLFLYNTPRYDTNLDITWLSCRSEIFLPCNFTKVI